MRLFGTDGIRGLANVGVMSPEAALLLGRAIGLSLYQHIEYRRPQVVLGRDTRLSGCLIEHALVAGLCSAGVDVLFAGIVPTPAVATITQSLYADTGLMVTASHNPFEENGVKVFGQNGLKLTEDAERKIEGIIHNLKLGSEGLRPTGRRIGKTSRIDNAIVLYIEKVRQSLPESFSLQGLKVVVDCAHGAAYRIAPDLLKDLGAEVIAIGVTPDGSNINDSCGATNTEKLIERVGREGADIGIALDGDADRVILVDETQSVLDGDQVLAILGRTMNANGQLKGNRVVATVMSNLGLDTALRKHNVTVERVQVGDRHVMAKMIEEGLNLGGEQSGHIILKDFSTTGDGLATALAILNIMVTEKKTLSVLGSEMVRYPQVLKSFKVSSKPPLESLLKTNAIIASIEKRLGDRGRVLVRYSGTEQKARIMVEGEDERLISKFVEDIHSVMLGEITLISKGFII